MWRRLLIVALVLMIVLLAISPLIGVLTWNGGGAKSLTYMKGDGGDFRSGIPPGTLVFVLALTALFMVWFVRRALVNTDALYIMKKATIRLVLAPKGHITREFAGLFTKGEAVDHVDRKTRSRRLRPARGPALITPHFFAAGATGG